MSSSSPLPSPLIVFSLLASRQLLNLLVLVLMIILLSSVSSSDATNYNTTSSHLSHDLEAQIIPFSSSIATPHNHKCIPEHLSALLRLKRGFNLSYNSFTSPLSSWNAKNQESCCAWEGITCNTRASTAHVIGLDLSGGYFLGGAIDFGSLFRLRSLERLDLSENFFDGSPIPFGFSQLTNLTLLRLCRCNLYGQFPPDIFWLSRLVSLDLAGNSLKLESVAGLGESFRNLSSLRELYLDSTDMSALGSRWSQMLAYATNLRELTMRDCGLSGPIYPSFSRLHFLTHLHLSDNDISSSVPQFIGNFTSLMSLGLSNSGFHGEFPKRIFTLPKLQTLDISGNPFLTIYLPQVSSSTSNCTIRELQMSDTTFHGSLADFLRNFQSSTDLYLHNCSIFGPIPQPRYMNLSQLVTLDLSLNHLSGVLDLSFFQDSEKLWILDLSYNSLEGVNDARSNSTLTSFPQLGYLSLASCNISKFPEVLRNQLKLYTLDLSCNGISGKIPEWIWAVGIPGGLLYLNLSNNALEGLEGASPHLSLLMMEFLDLSSNLLEGSVIIPPPSAYFFSLANNRLHGEVPSLICSKSLQILDLSSNNFTGVIPQCLGELSNLLVLSLSKNAFRGPLLQTFATGCQLETLDLSNNELEGQIPRSLANCQQLTVLNLGNNYVRDAFPSHLANLPQLSVFVLRSNQFYGSIRTPSASQSQPFFPHLQIIDASFNNLSGMLPSDLFSAWMMMKDAGSTSQFLVVHPILDKYYYQDRVMLMSKGSELEFVKIFTALTVIDLSHNGFHGDIPSSIGELKSLILLNMSHNHLQGQIPPSLGNLRELEALDLSQNNLYGKIPEDLSELSFLAAVNLSDNHLSGSIPQGGHFGTFQNDSFLGNPGLCGPPLAGKCKEDAVRPPPLPSRSRKERKSEVEFMWMGFAVGHTVGFGVFFWTMVLWRKGRHGFFQFFDRATTLAVGKIWWFVIMFRRCKRGN